jgi:hypothetical protein
MDLIIFLLLFTNRWYLFLFEMSSLPPPSSIQMSFSEQLLTILFDSPKVTAMQIQDERGNYPVF